MSTGRNAHSVYSSHIWPKYPKDTERKSFDRNSPIVVNHKPGNKMGVGHNRMGELVLLNCSLFSFHMVETYEFGFRDQLY